MTLTFILRVLTQILELWDDNLMTDEQAKRTGRSEREVLTPLFLLRCCEVGVSILDIDLLTIEVVLDMWTEKSNDGVKYRRIADQTDFDKT